MIQDYTIKKLLTDLVPLIKVEDGPLPPLVGKLAHIHTRAPTLDRVAGILVLVVIKLKSYRV